MQKVSGAFNKTRWGNRNVSFGTALAFRTTKQLNGIILKEITQVRPDEIYPSFIAGKNLLTQWVDICTVGVVKKKEEQFMTHAAPTVDVFSELINTQNNYFKKELDIIGSFSSAIIFGGKNQMFAPNRGGLSLDVFNLMLEKIQEKTTDVSYFSGFKNGCWNLLFVKENNKMYFANDTWSASSVPKSYKDLKDVFDKIQISKNDELDFN